VLGLLDIGPWELLIVAIGAILLFGGDLPDVARRAGRTLGRLRSMAGDLARSADLPPDVGHLPPDTARLPEEVRRLPGDVEEIAREIHRPAGSDEEPRVTPADVKKIMRPDEETGPDAPAGPAPESAPDSASEPGLDTPEAPAEPGPPRAPDA
jgi:Sec-independent protein translocase protein TatA